MTIGSSSLPAAFFVGDHLAVDFLNSTSTPSGVRTEWLRNGTDLVNWLEQAGAIDATVATRFRAEGEALDGVAEQARSLREWLRAFVLRYAGSELGAEALADLAPLTVCSLRMTATGRSKRGRKTGSRTPRIDGLCGVGDCSAGRRPSNSYSRSPRR